MGTKAKILMLRRQYILLGIICIIAVLLRFYHLGDYPQGLHKDEAFLGYNAYSILKTGKDMSGNIFPIHIQSFLYSPAGYAYFSIPFIYLFGLDAFSIRFASALFGSLTVFLTFFLTKELFTNEKRKVFISLISAFLLSITPWHINLSRSATENVLVVFFLTSGILFYLYWIKKQRKLWLLFFSFLSFFITLFIYQAPRAFLPFFIPFLIFIFKERIINKKHFYVMTLLFITSILIPLFLILYSNTLSLRIKTVSIFSTQGTKLVIDEQIAEDGVSHIPAFAARLFHNKIIGFSNVFLQNYMGHFSYDFLFTDNSLPIRYKVPSVGVLFLYDLPLLLCGVWFLIKSNKKIAYFILGWILIVPIGSALTFDDVPNVQRTLIFFPALSIISANGLLFLSQKQLLKRVCFPLLTSIICLSMLFYLHEYYIHARIHRPWYRNEGYKELVREVSFLTPRYKKAVITDKEAAPTIFFLFYTVFDPKVFQKQTLYTKMHDFDRIDFANFTFSQEECPLRLKTLPDGKTKITGEKGILYIDSGVCRLPQGAMLIGKIKRSDESTVFKMMSVN
jgi:4-amino-4-deoxy-L-arabinose transferase-like glycosyltransferase